MTVRVVDVALPVPVAQHFTYELPSTLSARVGSFVICPLRGRKEGGIVLAVRDAGPNDPTVLKRVIAVEPDLGLPEGLARFLAKLATYYAAPVGEAMALALPPRPKNVAELLQPASLFPEKSGGIGRRVHWVRATPNVSATSRRGAAGALLAFVRSVGESELAELEKRWKNARAIAKNLAEDALVEVFDREKSDAPFFRDEVARDEAPTLRQEQADAVDEISTALRSLEHKLFLLQGVTGSGKTEVYLHAMAEVAAAGRGAILLVPEIALTPQVVQRFRARFGDAVAILHSGLTPKERLGMWRRLRSAEVKVAIGARSALFAPVADLGLVIVDEEHDGSFKQEEGVRYQARDMAILRAHLEGAVCVLGSATPSLESVYLARKGQARHLHLRERARSQPLPKVEIVDLRRAAPGPGGDKRWSLPLHRALEQTLAEKEQAILFLNRRGFSPSARCEACGTLVECPHCSVAMTYHKGKRRLICHYCDYQTDLPEVCAKCKAPALALEGLGTEQLQETLSTLFPEARIERLDRDVASGKEVERILGRMRAGAIDVLVGTQMVTKGHDLPNVTLVGVINADAALSIPDFRAEERAFQLLVQVAGRAGRGDRPGRVLVQTYAPEAAAITLGVRHDVIGFAERELAAREEANYPPYGRLILVRVESQDEAAAIAATAMFAEELRRRQIPGLSVLGPSVAPLAKLRNYHRHRVLLKSSERPVLRRALAILQSRCELLPNKVRVSFDIDPVQLL